MLLINTSLNLEIMKRVDSRMNPGDMIDRISALPDSVLSLILSFLPTKNAVATSILSKRWKLIWIAVNNLDFCHDGRRKKQAEYEDLKFVRFVNRVFFLHDGGFLNKFRLLWKPRCIPCHASSWIRIAITRNVREFFLCVETPYREFKIPKPFKLTKSVFTCETLVSLELNGSIRVSDAIVVRLPSLESLKLVSVNFQSENSFERLVSGCPLLKFLHLHMDIDKMTEYFGRDDDFKYVISSTSLRRFELCIEYKKYVPEEIFYCSLELEASSLEYIKVVGFICQISVKGGSLTSLVEADFRIQMLESQFSQTDICNSIVEAVRAFDYAKALTLSPDAMWALSCATIPLCTVFMRLTKLEAGTVCCYCSSLQDFIQSSINLEVLTIYQLSLCPDEDNPNHSNWTNPIEIPRCLLNSLKSVVLVGYSGFDDERDMICYMLKHGSVLEVMHVSCGRFMDDVKFESLQKISKFPRKSEACKVEFLGWTSTTKVQG